LIAENTIEEDICNIIDTKRKVLDAVLDGRDTEDSSLLSELIGKIKERR
jgi:SNF2 family DNA or RNA helicase